MKEVTKESALDPPSLALSDEVSRLLKKQIEASGVPPKLTVGETPINASELLPIFYVKQNYKPAWSDNNGLLPQAEVLMKIIRDADREGLNPNDYHFSQLETALREIHQDKVVSYPNYQSDDNSPNPRNLANIDLLLTDAFLLYGSHLLHGRINPKTVDAAWLIEGQEQDLIELLRTALSSNKLEETLKNVLPQHPSYARLRQALIRYREIADKGGWPALSDGPKMEKGERSERVAVLRRRLAITGDLNEESTNDSEVFDDSLEQGLRNFQRRHGLKADGIVGQATLAALNIRVEKRINQIELNMERLRWLPQNLGSRYILVNLANFELYVAENNQTIMSMRVIVGKPYWNTPVFTAEMTYLVLNPHWNIPQTIFAEEKLPKIKKDPEYFSKDKIKVLKGWSPKVQEIDPTTIDWSKVTEHNFSYRLRQEPGSGNPLGRIKFMFPNPYHVYLHDTPQKNLFSRTDRNLSHGCIRIEKPLDLAEYVLHLDPAWTPQKIRNSINKGLTQSVGLPEPIPVYLVYFTAWVDDDGSIEFRNDIYGRDEALYQALHEAPLTI
ncbi:MAG: L,D-transpeptidase family protein [Deltaproteobacteria bacterium]|nr:L,D-transpeptidase family protein [Deltaproteobacteria bacterium]